jgi:hypothetical protein
MTQSNLDGVRPSSTECGLTWLQSTRHASILDLASSIEMNQFSLRHSSRSLPVKLSAEALSTGLPGG